MPRVWIKRWRNHLEIPEEANRVRSDTNKRWGRVPKDTRIALRDRQPSRGSQPRINPD